MYSSYAFWRQGSSLKTTKKGESSSHTPIIINNIHKISITESNLQAFLKEGEKARMHKLIHDNGIEQHCSIIVQDKEKNTQEKVTDGDTDTQRTDSTEPDLQCKSVEEAKTYLRQYSQILNVFAKFDIEKIHTIAAHLNDIYSEYVNDLEEITLELKLIDYLKDMLVYYKIKDLENDEVQPTSTTTEQDLFVNTILALLSDMTDHSEVYSKAVMEAGLIKYCALISKNPLYVDNQQNEEAIELLDGTLTVIHNCVRHVPGDPVYEQENIKQVVEVFLSSKVNVLRVLSIMIISAVISEDENTKMEHAGVIPYMVQSFNVALISADQRYDGFNIMEFLECLIRIAANDSNKVKIIEAGILPGLVTMLKEGEDKEKMLAAKLIWVLCFDDDAKLKVIQEVGCLDALKELSKSDDGQIKRMANGALWKIQGEEQYHEKQQQKMEDKVVDDSERHIFISYQWDHQKMVLKVKDRLKKEGFKIWIDVEEMGGSTLESMAHAVENAKVVLVCASEKYKISPNCRTEAEYLFQLKKPIVPLMLQRYYKPDGWLGMLLGAKMYVNFDGKYEFDYAYGLLQKELQKFSGVSKAGPIHDVIDGAGLQENNVLARPFSSSSFSSFSKLKAAKWNNQQIREWASQNDFNSLSNKLQSMFEKMDGELLIHLLKMKLEAPEFFYRELKTQFDMDLFDTIQLNKALESLLRKG